MMEAKELANSRSASLILKGLTIKSEVSSSPSSSAALVNFGVPVPVAARSYVATRDAVGGTGFMNEYSFVALSSSKPDAK